MTFIKDDFFLRANSKSKGCSRLMRAKIIKGDVDLLFKNKKHKADSNLEDKKIKNDVKSF